MTACGGHLDAVYFLMFAGWEKELRANRWHYASRWARHIPVTLVQPTPLLSEFDSYTVAEPNIDNCRVLHVRELGQDHSSLVDSLIQCEQIRRDIAAGGHNRVAFWLYDPSYFLTWTLLPAAVRVVHATENYFMFSSLPPQFGERLKYCLAYADLTICCSEGVAASYEPWCEGRVETITNGCDYEFYANAVPDDDLAALRKCYDSIVVFAGNVDQRLDYVAIAMAADAHPKILFAFFGPTSFTDTDNDSAFQRLCARPNIRYFGRVSAERLPAIYAACDVGILPYISEPLLYKNGFPLKTFEMAAGGLPIVAQNLQLIEPFAGDGIIYARSREEFASAFGVVGRDMLTESVRQNLEELARAQDYEPKFEAVRRMVESIACSSRARAPITELFLSGQVGFNEPFLRLRKWESIFYRLKDRLKRAILYIRGRRYERM